MASRKQTFKKGALVRVTGNTNSNDYTIGEVYRIKSVSDDTIRCESLDGSWNGNNLRKTDCELTGLTVEHYEANLVELQSEMDETQSIIDWMRETGATEYDATEHKVWSVMNAVENDSLTKLEKVKLIASLVKK